MPLAGLACRRQRRSRHHQRPDGLRGIVTGRPGGKTAWALTDALAAAPDRIFDLTPPVVIASLDTDDGRLRLFTDALGLGRLYELRCRWGTVWSNRPVAALRFAGRPAVASIEGWRSIAAADWPAASFTAYEGVEAVPAATHVDAVGGGITSTSQNVLEKLLQLSERGLESCLESAADDLVRAAVSMSNLWAEPPLISLSGGRDSRLAAAAFLASGFQPRFRTIPSYAGEVDTVRRLMEITGNTDMHTFTEKAFNNATRGPLLERGVRWHRASEGHAATNRLYRRPPRSSARARRLRITGSGADFAHGTWLPRDVAQVERYGPARRRRAWSSQIHARMVLPRGLAGHSIDLIDSRIEQVLAEAARHGIDDSRAITSFYLTERTRRWDSTAGSGLGRPLLATGFVAAAFAAGGKQLKDGILYQRLIADLVPPWAEVPFFSPRLEMRNRGVKVFPWDEIDRDDITALLLDELADWRDPFDPDTVLRVWSAGLRGKAAARDDQLMQRVLWRATFASHLDAVNGESAPGASSSTPRVTDLPRRGRGGSSLARMVATRANEWLPARRMARTRLGRMVRRWIGV